MMDNEMKPVTDETSAQETIPADDMAEPATAETATAETAAAETADAVETADVTESMDKSADKSADTSDETPDKPETDGNASVKPEYASQTARKIAVIAAAAVAAVFFLWGLLFFLRPAVSETEKRELTPFPTLTWDGFLNGEWTEGISRWYADTFPGRDGLTGAWNGVQSLFGIRNEQFRGGEGDDIPDETMGVDTAVETPTGQDEPGTLDPNEGGDGETV